MYTLESHQPSDRARGRAVCRQLVVYPAPNPDILYFLPRPHLWIADRSPAMNSTLGLARRALVSTSGLGVEIGIAVIVGGKLAVQVRQYGVGVVPYPANAPTKHFHDPISLRWTDLQVTASDPPGSGRGQAATPLVCS